MKTSIRKENIDPASYRLGINGLSQMKLNLHPLFLDFVPLNIPRTAERMKISAERREIISDLSMWLA